MYPENWKGRVGESSYPAVFEIRGEMYVKEDALERFNEKKIANGETPFKNARNAAAGIMRMKEPNVDVPLSFIPHGWGSPPERGGESAFFKTQIEFYESVKSGGFRFMLNQSIVSSDGTRCLHHAKRPSRETRYCTKLMA